MRKPQHSCVQDPTECHSAITRSLNYMLYSNAKNKNIIIIEIVKGSIEALHYCKIDVKNV